MSASDLARHMAAVAREFWGEPNRHLSTQSEPRWGTQGARVVDAESGTWYDHEAKAGGGVLDLIQRETGATGKDAFDWLRERGFAIEDLPNSPRSSRRGAAQISKKRSQGCR